MRFAATILLIGLFSLGGCGAAQTGANESAERIRTYHLNVRYIAPTDGDRELGNPRIMTVNGTSATITTAAGPASESSGAAGDRREHTLTLIPTAVGSAVRIDGTFESEGADDPQGRSFSTTVADGGTFAVDIATPMTLLLEVTVTEVTESVDTVRLGTRGPREPVSERVMLD